MNLTDAITTPPLGLDFRKGSVRAVSGGTFRSGDLCQFDLRGLQSDTVIVGKEDSGLSVIVPASATGFDGSEWHGIVRTACTPGQEVFVDFAGILWMRLSSAPTLGQVVTLIGDIAGARILGRVINTTPVDGKYQVVFDGEEGFGQIVAPDGGGTNEPPVAALTADTMIAVAPVTVGFDASGSTDPDGSITKYEFDFGVGAGFVDNGATATTSRLYSFPGVYTITVRVTDDGTPTLRDVASVTIILTNNSGSTQGDTGAGGEGGGTEEPGEGEGGEPVDGGIA